MSIIHKRKKHESNIVKEDKEMKEGLSIYAPWIIFYRQVQALFTQDPEVNVIYNDDEKDIVLYVDNPTKAEALSKLLPASRIFGTVKVTVTVVPANAEGDDRMKYLEAAFKGNDAFSHISTVQDIPPMHLPNPITYCVFKKEVVQYDADDLSSESGKASTLYQDLAKEVFGDIGGVYFCTDTYSEM